MENMRKIKNMLCKELKVFAERDDISMSELETIHKITDTIKNIDKIAMFKESEEGYSERYYHDGGSSYARGRRYAKRDSMGRYSRDDGYSEEDFDSHDSYDSSFDMGSHKYSRDDAKGRMMHQLGDMMRSADSHERRILEECMKKLEKA